MSFAFSFAPMQVLINDPGSDINAPESRALTFWDDNYNEVVPTAATKMRIKGFGPIFTKSRISKVIGVRGNAGSVETLTLDATNITVAGTIPVNSTVRIAMNVNSINKQGEHARTYQYGSWEYLQISVEPGETVATFLAKLYNAINYSSQGGTLRELVSVDEVSSTGTFDADGTATSVTSLAINTVELGMYFDIRDGFKITSAENAQFTSPYVQFTDTTVGAITTQGYEGRGNYQELKGVFMEDDTAPYHFHRYERPLRGTLYTAFNFSHAAPEEVGGNNIPNEVLSTRTPYTVYVNETLCVTTQQELADFLAGATTIDTPVFYSEAQLMIAEAVADFKL